ncbi:unnamed protein product, partial [Schistosoma turkestanicum]
MNKIDGVTDVPKINKSQQRSTNKQKAVVENQISSTMNHSPGSLGNNSPSVSRQFPSEDLINSYRNKSRLNKFISRRVLIVLAIVLSCVLVVCLTNTFYGRKYPSASTPPFWKSTVGYWLDVFAFKDSSGDLVGDLNGLTSEIDYIKTVIGAGYVILGPITKGFYNNSFNILGLVEDYEQLDEAVGTMDDFRALLKQFHKKGVKVVLTLNFNAISLNHKWISENKVKLKPFEDSFMPKFGRYAHPSFVNFSERKFYSVFGEPNVDLDLTDPATLKQIFNVIDSWMSEGIDGILLDNAAYFVEIKEKIDPSCEYLDQCSNSQMYTDESVIFVKAVKGEIEKWIKNSGKD